MKKFSSCRNGDEGVMKDNSCEGRLVLDGWVASVDRRSIGNVGSGSGNVQHGNKLSRILC